MNPRHIVRTDIVTALVALVATLTIVVSARSGTKSAPSLTSLANSAGTAGLLNLNGPTDQTNPFFQKLGTNGRTCATCHVPDQGMSITPEKVAVRFSSTKGLDPIFRTNDGTNCPSADVSTTDARRTAYSLLLNKGLIRVSLPVPSNADFTITFIDDPYGCSETTATKPAFYRRPLPSVNLPFLATVMWDGRQTVAGDLNMSLINQAKDAILGHAEATAAPTDLQLAQIVTFERALFFAQTNDSRAGNLTALGSGGGPTLLSTQEFYPGINDPLGGNPRQIPFTPNIFGLYDSWSAITGTSSTDRARAAVARGQVLFNNLPISIAGVAGLNDVLGASTIPGTCGTCHDSPNVGNHSVSLPIDIGISDVSRHTPDMPLYTVTCANGQVKQTQDLGRAMITGKCSDIGKFKGPILRGLAARAPYFHDGSAATLLGVVEFYNARFNLNLSDQQKSDFAAFLRTL
jgi:cytochrome c peroxidase